MRNLERWVRVGGVVVLGAVMAAGCGKKQLPPQAPAPPPVAAVAPPAPPAPPPAPAPAPARALTDDELFAQKSLADLNGEGPLRHAFFDVDSATLRTDAQSDMQANATWLRRWPSTRISVEGHGDSRGTSEYNLALGERRANVVREYLSGLGIEPQRVAVVSKGEEQPFCRDESESCWQSNRRGHFIITAK